jgi:hypothetical protein
MVEEIDRCVEEEKWLGYNRQQFSCPLRTLAMGSLH